MGRRGRGELPSGSLRQKLEAADVNRLQHDSDPLRERCLLFVACNRAQEALDVTWSGSPLRCLPADGREAP
ncbi:hypothetical protein GCM10023263_33500 [Phytohabitans rumicis]